MQRVPTQMLSRQRLVVRAPLRAHRRHLHLLFGTANIPHPSKRDKGGEDAFFADPVSGAFGVADGVGGSARDGVDPGLFSRTMLSHCQRYLAEHSNAPPSGAHLARAMAASSAALLEHGYVVPSAVLLREGAADPPDGSAQSEAEDGRPRSAWHSTATPASIASSAPLISPTKPPLQLTAANVGSYEPPSRSSGSLADDSASAMGRPAKTCSPEEPLFTIYPQTVRPTNL